METGDQVSKIVEQSPLLSIIVPAYNIERYLPDCLDSLLSQTYQNLEIILVDDGSSDRTGSVADAYREKYPQRVTCIHQENKGVFQARLVGIAAAKGDWIGFVDGDDRVCQDMFQCLMHNAIQHGTDISHCGYQTIVNNGERVHYFHNTGRMLLLDRENGLRSLLEGTLIEPGLWNKVFKKRLFEFLGKMELPTDVKINEDLLLNYFLFKNAASSVFEDVCLYSYIARDDSATRSEFRLYKAMDPVRVCKMILDDADPCLKKIAWKKYLLVCCTAIELLREANQANNEQKKLKRILLDNRKKWKWLGKRGKMKTIGILFFPNLYYALKKVYGRFRQKDYE